MKILAIFAAVSIILTLYFIVDIERSIVVKGNEAVPAGTDISSAVVSVSKGIMAKIQEFTGNKDNVNADVLNNLGPAVTEEIKEKALELQGKIKDLSPEVQRQIIEIIEEPIKNKIKDILCQ